jgi:hypothetical protein
VIEYTESVDGVAARHLVGFFVGWADPPSPERHLALLRGSDDVILAREDLEPFYRRFGLRTWDRGMGIRNREALRR